jgi:hypothetical protein
MLGQGTTKGPDPLSSDQPVKFLAGELSSDDQKKLVLQVPFYFFSSFMDRRESRVGAGPSGRLGL